MININGRSLSESYVTIINGRVVNGAGTAKTQKFDEKKFENVNNVEKIAIDSTFADVNISVSDSSRVEVHFYGQAEIFGDVNFDVRKVNRELRITLKFAGNCCCNSNLKLDVTVPGKTFKEISAKNIFAKITLSKNVSTEFLKVKTLFGDLETSETFANSFITIMGGKKRT